MFYKSTYALLWFASENFQDMKDSYFSFLQDSLLSLAGSFLYIAVGAITIDNNFNSQGPRYDTATALGSFAIITGW